MENEKRTHGSEWPYFELSLSWSSMKNAKSRKKVFLVDRFRNAATLEAVGLAAMLQRGNFNAGFSIIDLIHSIPTHIEVSCYPFQDTRRQLQHYNKAPDWKYTTAELKAVFYQLAMLQQAEQSDRQLTPFTVNLTPEFVNKALQNKKGFIDYTKRQIDKAMLSELSRKPQYWFIVELANVFGGYTKGRIRPHLHGGILLTQSERESIRKQRTPISEAFHKAVGKCHPDFSERLLVMGDHKAYAENSGITETMAAINWAGYCFKENGFKVKQFLNTKTNLTADNVTKSQAEAIYKLLTPKSAKLSPIDENELEAFMN